jgi:hypothetical protein
MASISYIYCGLEGSNGGNKEMWNITVVPYVALSNVDF